MKLKDTYRVLAIGVAVAVIGINAPTSAYAQGAGDCACVVPAALNGQPIGSITGVSGQVQVSQAAGFGAGGAGTPLQLGTQIIVGPLSSALISVGASCSLQIQQNTDVVIDALNSDICVRVKDFAGETAGASNTVTEVEVFGIGIGTGAIAVGVAGVGAVGGVVTLAVSKSDPVSD